MTLLKCFQKYKEIIFITCILLGGKTYARCKNNLVWSNYVRAALKSETEITHLDALTSNGTQFGGIEVSLYCDLFKSSTAVFCTGGCQPLPQDYETNWKISYHSNSPDANINKAPIVSNSQFVSTVSCRKGYAQIVGSSTLDKVQCTTNGWSPANLFSLITCKPGCGNVVIPNGIVNEEPSLAKGTAPYTIGAIVSLRCGDGFVLSSDIYLTCTSLLRWKPKDTPTCISRTLLSNYVCRLDYSWIVMSVLLYVSFHVNRSQRN